MKKRNIDSLDKCIENYDNINELKSAITTRRNSLSNYRVNKYNLSFRIEEIQNEQYVRYKIKNKKTKGSKH